MQLPLQQPWLRRSPRSHDSDYGFPTDKNAKATYMRVEYVQAILFVVLRRVHRPDILCTASERRNQKSETPGLSHLQRCSQDIKSPSLPLFSKQPINREDNGLYRSSSQEPLNDIINPQNRVHRNGTQAIFGSRYISVRFCPKTGFNLTVYCQSTQTSSESSKNLLV